MKPVRGIIFHLHVIFLAFIYNVAYSEEFETVCRSGHNQTINCKTKSVGSSTPDVAAQISQPFSHILVLNGNEAILLPRIPQYSCPDMRNHIFSERLQKSKDKESVIYETKLCVTVAGLLYPKATFSDVYSIMAFDMQYTHDAGGRQETILTIEKNPGWFRCRKEARERILTGHIYACYKSKQDFSDMRKSTP